MWLSLSSRNVGRPIDTSSACLPSGLPYFCQFSLAACQQQQQHDGWRPSQPPEPFREAVLPLASPPTHLIREGLVGLADHHEHLLGVLVAGVLVGVPLERERAVGLADHAVVGVAGDLQDDVRVELRDVAVVPHQHDQVDAHHVGHRQEDDVGEEADREELVDARRLLLQEPRLPLLRLRHRHTDRAKAPPIKTRHTLD